MIKILIAEDEKILAQLLREKFEEAGFRVLMAENGEDALNMMKSREDRPDAVILDLLMPVMDGFMVLEEVSKDLIYQLKDLPIFVLSNLGQDEDIKRALKFGARDYFVKTQHPVAEIVDSIKKIFPNRLKSGNLSLKP